MTDVSQKMTRTDLEIGRIYYGILIEQARSGTTLTYGELVAKAKALHPDNEAVRLTIPVSAGRRLEAVRLFTNERGYPDITSLVVNANTGEVGTAFGTNPVAHRAQIAEFDWTSIDEHFDLYLARQHAALPVKRQKSTKADLRRMIWEFYNANKARLPAEIVRHRDALEKMMMAGHSIADAFERVAAEKQLPPGSTSAA